MSYKFEIHRCDRCAAVWFDPYIEETENDAGISTDVGYPCRLVYVDGGGVSPCAGTVRRYIGVDSDTFLYVADGWRG